MVLAKARALEAAGRDIIHLEIGEPDFETPPKHCRSRGQGIARTATPTTARPTAFRNCARQSPPIHWNGGGIEHSPEQVLVTPGGKPVMFYAILALCQPGDEVIYPNPGFPIYESMINYVGARAVPMPLLSDNNFRVDLDRLAADLSDRTRLLILNSPGNPTGGMLTSDDLVAIAKLLSGRDVVILADEIYKDIIYGAEFESIAAIGDLAEQTIILDGFSKSYAMTGWRLGYAIGPQPIIDVMAQMQVNAVSCTAGFVQMAGVDALTGSQDSVRAMAAEFGVRRQIVVEGLNEIEGVSCKAPGGAFYAFPELGKNATELADRLLDEAGVAVLAGSAFGAYGANGVRISFANSQDNLRRALGRVKSLIESL